MTEFVEQPSGKVQCTVCGRRGWPGGTWRLRCEEGHPWQCVRCGRRFASLQARASHLNAPKRGKCSLPPEKHLDSDDPV